MPRDRVAIAATALVLLLVPAASALTGNPYVATLATQVVIFALAVAALDLVVGYGGMVSFGHAAFFAIGAYTVAFSAQLGLTEALATWPLAAALAGVCALAIGALSVRTSGIFFIMITLAFAQMIYFLATGIRALGGDDGLPMTVRNTLAGLDVSGAVPYYCVVLAIFAGFVVLSQRAIRARFGTVVRAAMQNERRTESLGFDVYRFRVVAFAISGAITGLAGALFGDFSRIATADLASWNQSGDLLVMLILGGAGTLLGPLYGAALFIVLQTILLGLTSHWMLVLGPILIVVVLTGRRGLASLVAGAKA